MIDLVTLGRCAVLHRGTSVPLEAGSAGFLLLVYLAVEGPVPADGIRTLFWPGLPREDADRRLDEVLARCAEALGSGVVSREGRRIRLDLDAVDADVRRLRQAEEDGRPWDVLAIYGGPFLEGVEIPLEPGPGEGAPGEWQASAESGAAEIWGAELRRWVEETREGFRSACERARGGVAWREKEGEEFWGTVMREVRSRSVLYATVLYLGFVAGSIQVLGVLIENTGIPESAFPLVLILLALGLPIVVGLVWLLDGGGPAFLREGRLAGGRLRPIHMVAVLGILALGSGSGWVALHWLGDGGVAAAWAELPQERSVAVLPFRSAEGELLREALGHEIEEAVARSLSRVERRTGALWMVPSADLREEGIVAREDVHRRFGVNLVVEGRVLHSADTVDVLLELKDARDGRTLRGARFRSEPGNVRAMEAKILDSLAELLDLELGGAERDALGVGSTDDPLARGFYVQGRRYLERFERQEQVDLALAQFERALARDPDFALARAAMGEAWVRRYDLTRDLADLERGRNALETVLEQGDPFAEAHVTLGLIHRQTGRHEEAVEAYRRALELEPHSADAHLGIARAQQATGRMAEAEGSFQRAVELRSDWGGYNQLGDFYFTSGRFADAEEAFRAVTELAPDNHRGWANLGGALAALGRDGDAEEALRRSVEIAPNEQALSNLGTIHFARGDYARAVEKFEEAVALDDRYYDVWGNLASASRRMGGAEERVVEACIRVAELARAALDVNPRDVWAMTYLASCYLRLGEPDRSRTFLRRIEVEEPTDIQVLFQMGTIYEDLGDRDRAVRWIVEALERGYPSQAVERTPGLEGIREDSRVREVVGDRATPAGGEGPGAGAR